MFSVWKQWSLENRVLELFHPECDLLFFYYFYKQNTLRCEVPPSTVLKSRLCTCTHAHTHTLPLSEIVQWKVSPLKLQPPIWPRCQFFNSRPHGNSIEEKRFLVCFVANGCFVWLLPCLEEPTGLWGKRNLLISWSASASQKPSERNID